jgi:hypothetical protein
MTENLIERLGKASHRLLNGNPGQTERAAIGVTCRLSADDLEAAHKRIEELEWALEEIACRHVTVQPLWWQRSARAALQPEHKEGE